MPRLSTAIDRANAILRALSIPFRLREGHGSRWLSIYENCPGRRVRERSARGYAARDDRDVERLCSRLLEHAQNCPDQGLDDLFTGIQPALPGVNYIGGRLSNRRRTLRPREGEAPPRGKP